MTTQEHPLNEVETEFYEAAKRVISGLVPQYQIGQYRVDFAVPCDRLAIEIDGREYHSEHQQLYHDKPRQREIEAQGWTVIRFEAWEVCDDVKFCVRRARKWLELKRNGLHIERLFPA